MLVEKARAKDEEADILDILGEIQHPDTDGAIMHIWQEDPLNNPWMLWGYKEDCGNISLCLNRWHNIGQNCQKTPI